MGWRGRHSECESNEFLRAPRSILAQTPPLFLYRPPSWVSWLGLWPEATPPPTKRASAPVVLLKAVGALPDTDGEMMSPESRRSFGHRSNGLRIVSFGLSRTEGASTGVRLDVMCVVPMAFLRIGCNFVSPLRSRCNFKVDLERRHLVSFLIFHQFCVNVKGWAVVTS
jgi:hypothetical protein|eukprot:5230868-Prymnesium_polylepis.1